MKDWSKVERIDYDNRGVYLVDHPKEPFACGEMVLASDFDSLLAELRETRRVTVEEIATYIESDSDCLMPIVLEETKRDYGVRLLKVMADEIRAKFSPEARTELQAEGSKQ